MIMETLPTVMLFFRITYAILAGYLRRCIVRGEVTWKTFFRMEAEIRHSQNALKGSL